MSNTLPTYDDVIQASQRLDGLAHTTPVHQSRTLNERLGAQIFFKCENFQRIGAFKFRGAYNAIVQLDPAAQKRGVVTFSSGNHAQAVALAAQLLGAPATVIMPRDAPQIKKAATRAYGAQVIEYDRNTQNREEIAQRQASEHGFSLIPPFDHFDVIAGQGTAVKELIEEVGPLDALYVPLGGGGLLAGSLLAAHALSPECAVYGVEPEAGDDGQQSFRSGQRVRINPPASIADGALTQQLGTLTFALIQRYARDVCTVSDAQLRDAMRFFAQRMKLVVEPTGCLGAAAVFAQETALKGQRIGVVLSGGNIDLDDYGRFLLSK